MNRIFQMIQDLLYEPIGGTPILGWHVLVILCAIVPFVLVATVFRKPWDRLPGVWRCVILSVIAHVVLIFYAYGTHYVVFTGPGKSGDPVAIQIVDDPELIDDSEASTTTIPAWDRFTNDVVAPEIEPLEHPREEPELVVERTLELEPDAPSHSDDSANVDPGSTPEFSTAPEILAPTDAAALDPTMTAESFVVPQASQLFPDWTPEVTATPIEVQRLQNAAAEPPSLVGAFEIPALSGDDEREPDRSPGELPGELPGALASEPAPQPPSQHRVTEADPALELTRLPPHPQEDSSSWSPVPSKLAGFERPPTQPRDKWLPRRLGDSQPMPKWYADRAPDGRLQIAEQRGGSVETEAAVERALQYLARNQMPDGRWSSQLSGGGVERRVLGQDRRGAGSRADMGITGLAVLAFLSAGNTQYEGPHRETVRLALRYLADHQAPDGNLAGEAQNFAQMYCHSMAMLAVSEALAVTGDPGLIPVVQRAVDFSVRAQSKIDGGWRYQPGDAGDMSQFGWQVLSLHSANLGGIELPQTTVSGMESFLERCTRGKHRGLGCYRPSEGHSASMTAEALVCRFLLSDLVPQETIDEAAQTVLAQPPSRDEINYYYWYYGTMAMHHAGGKYWQEWNRQLKPVLLAHQIRHGSEAGSWPADGLWSGYGGKIYSTALATLCLEAYYRYVPINELKARE